MAVALDRRNSKSSWKRRFARRASIAEDGARKALTELGVEDARRPTGLAASARSMCATGCARMRARSATSWRPMNSIKANRSGARDRLRALASRAVRPLPRREQSADRPRAQGRGVAVRLGGDRQGGRARSGGARRRLGGADAAADLPQGRSGARARAAAGNQGGHHRDREGVAARGVRGRRLARLGLPVLAGGQEGRGSTSPR